MLAMGCTKLTYQNFYFLEVVHPKKSASEEKKRVNYYPFGLKHKGYNANIVSEHDWKFQGQELEESLGLNVYEFELRQYDPAIGRFMTTDPYEQFDSPYVAMGNNPVVSFDPDGGFCYDANGNQIACPDDEFFDDVRDSETNHHNQLKEVVIESSKKDDDTEAIGVEKGTNVLEGKTSILGRLWATIEPRSVEVNGIVYNVDADGNVTDIQPLGGLGVAGLVGGLYNPKNLLKVANILDKGGLTKIGRALQKHASRSGSKFGQATGSTASLNAQGEKVLKEILKNPASTTTTRHHARFGDILEIKAPNGQGVRFSKDGKKFIGLLEN